MIINVHGQSLQIRITSIATSYFSIGITNSIMEIHQKIVVLYRKVAALHHKVVVVYH